MRRRQAILLDGKMTAMGSDGSGDASGAGERRFVDSLDAPLQ
jgi:hypothetical protein